MPRSDEFFTFDEVLKELKLSEDELKKMVSEGEVRAFKDEDRMKFKRRDIESKKSEHTTEPTVILPPGEGQLPATSNEATFIEEDTTSSISATEDMAVGSDTDIHLPGLLEEAEVTTPIEPVQDIGATVSEEEIGVAETIAKEGVIETVPEEFVETAPAKIKPPKFKPKIKHFASPPIERREFQPSAISVAMPIPKFKTPVVFIVLLAVILLFLSLVGSFISDSLRISSGKGKHPVGITREFGQMILDIVGIKDVNLDKFKEEK